MTEFIQGNVPSFYESPTNRHRGLRQVFYDNIPHLGFPQEPRFESTPGENVDTVKAGEEGRLDIIAAKVYNEPSLWWFIASVNSIFDPFTEMFAGMQLRIPPLTLLEA